MSGPSRASVTSPKVRRYQVAWREQRRGCESASQLVHGLASPLPGFSFTRPLFDTPGMTPAPQHHAVVSPCLLRRACFSHAGGMPSP